MNKLNHKFVPMKRDPRYCGVMLKAETKGSPQHGYFSMSVGCGYPPSAHMETEEDGENERIG